MADTWPVLAQYNDQYPPMPRPKPLLGGMRVEGNIDTAHRPVVRNPDGSISTVLTIGIGTDQGEVVIPRVSDDGRVLTNEEAIALYRASGKHLGIFDTPENATAYAKQLHLDQERMYR